MSPEKLAIRHSLKSFRFSLHRKNKEYIFTIFAVVIMVKMTKSFNHSRNFRYGESCENCFAIFAVAKAVKRIVAIFHHLSRWRKLFRRHQA
jgi:hypothetical protein